MLGLAIPAVAQAQLPPNNGGVDQYVAPVPDARGDRPANPHHQGPGGGGGGGGSSQLPPGVRGSLPAGGEGVLLSRLATDPGSGAPAGGDSSGGDRGGDGSSRDDRSGGSSSDDSGGGGAGSEEKDVTAASAITSSISDDPAVAVVVAAVIGLTLALAAIGLARRRRDT